MLCFKFLWAKITQGIMDPKIIVPVHVVGQFDSKTIQALEIAALNELCLKQFECGFCHSIIVGTALKTQGAANVKCVKHFVGELVVELAAPVRMKHLDPAKIGMYGCL